MGFSQIKHHQQQQQNLTPVGGVS